ncbi:MAG: bifunctional DNA-formamidopyrimidine glycosylase/DNA-(apurinic or apyrimidinic site) lyase [Saezia sp.]
MPELPEVEVTRMGIAPLVEHATIMGVRLGKPLRWPLGCEQESLVGQVIHHVRRRGKYLLLDLDKGILLLHLGMSGRLGFYQKEVSPSVHDHFDLVTSKGILRLHDPRRFGAVVWTPSEQEGMGKKLLGHLGVEPLSDDFDKDNFIQELKKRHAAIKQVLLSGNVVVGVGNIYANEVLFIARIYPRKSASKISAKKAKVLAQTIQEVLRQAIAYGGSSLKDFRAVHGEYGLFQIHAKVYGRAKEPCMVCKRPIKVIQQGQRSTYFCAYCQR